MKRLGCEPNFHLVSAALCRATTEAAPAPAGDEPSGEAAGKDDGGAKDRHDIGLEQREVASLLKGIWRIESQLKDAVQSDDLIRAIALKEEKESLRQKLRKCRCCMTCGVAKPNVDFSIPDLSEKWYPSCCGFCGKQPSDDQTVAMRSLDFRCHTELAFAEEHLILASRCRRSFHHMKRIKRFVKESGDRNNSLGRKRKRARASYNISSQAVLIGQLVRTFRRISLEPGMEQAADAYQDMLTYAGFF